MTGFSKNFCKNFFSEFIQAFFPQVYQELDTSYIRFLQQELFTDIISGQKHVVDLLAETRLKNEESLILIHVENQAQYQKDFPQRMFIYYSRLYEKIPEKTFSQLLYSAMTPREKNRMSFP